MLTAMTIRAPGPPAFHVGPPAEPNSPLVGAWEFEEEEDLQAVTTEVLDRRRPPDWRGRLVSLRGDIISVQLEPGASPSTAPTTRYYIEKRGPYLLLRREIWPGEPRERVILTLRAWPQRGLD
jgi:hypothetical protein